MARRAAKGVNERLHVVITRQVSLDRVYEGRDAQRVACIGHRAGPGGAGVQARSCQNERKKSCSCRRNADRRTFPLFVITARQEARARVA